MTRPPTGSGDLSGIANRDSPGRNPLPNQVAGFVVSAYTEPMRSYYVLREALEELADDFLNYYDYGAEVPTMTDAHNMVTEYDLMLRASRGEYLDYCRNIALLPDTSDPVNLAKESKFAKLVSEVYDPKIESVDASEIQIGDELVTPTGSAQVREIGYTNNIMHRGYAFYLTDGSRQGYTHSTDKVSVVRWPSV